MTKRKQMTGCQKQTTIGLLIVSSILAVVAFSIGYVRSEAHCTIVGTSTSDTVGGINVEFYLGSDEVAVEAVYQQVFATSDETRAFTDKYTHGETHLCGYNRWFPDQVVLDSDTVPTRHLFWFTLALAILIGGFALANMLNIIGSRELPPGQHQPVRLNVDGGEPSAWLWFLLPMTVTLGGAAVALFMAVRLRWLFWDVTFWLSLGLLALCGVGCLLSLYGIVRQLYLLRMGLETVVEISHQPVRSGQTATIYVSYKPGKLTLQNL